MTLVITDSFETALPEDAFKTEFFNDYHDTGAYYVVDETDYSVTVWLYQDSAFTTWAAAVDGTYTEDERTFAEDYSDYMLRMQCDITAVDSIIAAADRAGMGCCLWDLDNNGGGICSLMNSTADGLETFYLTNSQFQTAYDNNELSTDSYGPTTAYEGITTFWLYDDASVTDSTDYDRWTVIKVQPWPATAYSGTYRFVKDNEVYGMIYNPNETGSAVWKEERQTLNQAAGFSFVGAAAVVGLLATVF